MNLAQFLHSKTVDELKELAKLCDAPTYGRKLALIEGLEKVLLSATSLKTLWDKLDSLSKKAVTAAYHNQGEFNEVAFVAQYGSLPERPRANSMFWFSMQPILVDLFIHQNVIPDNMMAPLSGLMSPPERFRVVGLSNAPTVTQRYDNQPVPLLQADTERTGLHDLNTYLRMVDTQEVKVSSNSGKMTVGSARKLLGSLLDGDFLPLPEKARAADMMRTNGLHTFARDAGWITNGRSGLALTDTGRAYYRSRSPELLLDAFEIWSQQGSFDELSRISAIKGQKNSGTYLTKPYIRREAVIEALSWCPVNVWIDLQDFYRAVKIWHFDFDVESGYYSNLYVKHRSYGTLHGETYWLIVKGLYINAVLWEMLGTIGALDLCYVSAEAVDLSMALDDYFYVDEPVSLYDGLKYFRINPLGAYLLGQTGEYTPSGLLEAPFFTVTPDLQVSIVNPQQATPNDVSHLTQMAIPIDEAQGCYRLDTQQLLTTLESGGDLDYLANFLQQRHQGPLPQEAADWLGQIQRNMGSFQMGSAAQMINVKSKALADLVLQDPQLQKFCQPYNDTTLVIPSSRLTTFRKRLKALEYILSE